jgi:hypothetical protein
MFFVQMLAFSKSHEKLRAIRVLSTVGHGNYSPSRKFKPLMKLIFERFSINRLASCSCSCWVSSLDHESRDHAMKNSIVIVLVHAVLEEISGSERGFSSPDFYLYLSVRGEENDLCIGVRLFLKRSRLHDYKSRSILDYMNDA